MANKDKKRKEEEEAAEKKEPQRVRIVRSVRKALPITRSQTAQLKAMQSQKPPPPSSVLTSSTKNDTKEESNGGTIITAKNWKQDRENLPLFRNRTTDSHSPDCAKPLITLDDDGKNCVNATCHQCGAKFPVQVNRVPDLPKKKPPTPLLENDSSTSRKKKVCDCVESLEYGTTYTKHVDAFSGTKSPTAILDDAMEIEEAEDHTESSILKGDVNVSEDTHGESPIVTFPDEKSENRRADDVHSTNDTNFIFESSVDRIQFQEFSTESIHNRIEVQEIGDHLMATTCRRQKTQNQDSWKRKFLFFASNIVDPRWWLEWDR